MLVHSPEAISKQPAAQTGNCSVCLSPVYRGDLFVKVGDDSVAHSRCASPTDSHPIGSRVRGLCEFCLAPTHHQVTYVSARKRKLPRAYARELEQQYGPAVLFEPAASPIEMATFRCAQCSTVALFKDGDTTYIELKLRRDTRPPGVAYAHTVGIQDDAP